MMNRALFLCALLVVPPTVAQGQEDKIVRLTVSPAKAPSPILKYRLLPELSEMNPGNPILGYLKCFSGQDNFFYSKYANDQRTRWLDLPLESLPVQEMRGYGGMALKRADDAARLTTPDWQTLIPLKRSGISLIIPELQEMRNLAFALQTRFRGEVADKRFEDALTTAQTMFALSRHCSDHPTIIGNLVGIAIAAITMGRLEEMIQQPGCPNLYYALTSLPRPFIDLNKACQGQRLMWRVEFKILKENEPMTEAELEKAMTKGRELFGLTGFRQVPEGTFETWFKTKTQDEDYVKKARQRLVKAGSNKEVVGKFPPQQVIFLDEKLAFEKANDQMIFALHLPFRKGWTLLEESGKEGEEHKHLLLRLLGPWGQKAMEAKGRLDQRLALLCHIEALRMYAAEHQGKLPKTLSDINLPLPLDPVNNQPFQYALKDNKATLRGAIPAGRVAASWPNSTYEITLRK